MIVVVIPAKNEEDNILDLVQAVSSAMPAKWVKVVVANDSSSDRTVELAHRAGAEVVNVPAGRAGLGDVYRYGLKYALMRAPNAEAVVEMDAGFSHQPLEIDRLLRALEGNEAVFGYRFGERAGYAAPFRRRALSWLGTKLTNYLHAHSWKDATSGFAAYRPEALRRLLAQPIKSNGHYYNTEVRLQAKQLGLNVAQCPIHYRSSSSSLRPSAVVEALWLSFWYARDSWRALACAWLVYFAALVAVANMVLDFTYSHVLLALLGAGCARVVGHLCRMIRSA